MILSGLDIETTGTDPNLGHRLIQIGIFIKDVLRLSQDVFPTGNMTIQQEALDVNKFTLARIGAGLPTPEADKLISFGLKHAGFKHGELTPVGWNVGGFDLVFIKRELPEVAKFFTYRTLDLTGVAIMHQLCTGKPYRDLKDEFHKRIAEIIGEDKRHDALYDAEAALIAVDLFKQENEIF